MAHLNFLYQQDELQALAAEIIAKSVKMGATAAQVELSESISSSVEILNQEIENFETSHENQLLLTVFCGKRKGNIGLSTIAPTKLESIIRHALDIAKYTEADSSNGLLEEVYLAQAPDLNLELFHPLKIENEELISRTKEIEACAIEQSRLITASEGSSISLLEYNFVTANSNNFNRGYQTSRYSNYVGLIGKNSNGMQTDYWYSSARDFTDLLPSAELAAIAGQRVIRRLNKGAFNTSRPSIILESSIAQGIIGGLMGALSGSSLYRRLSFLNDSLGQQIFPSWLNISEDPFIIRGLASCYFDNEGGQVARRDIISQGTVNGYLLSSYSARKMQLAPTGNAGGNHNIIVKHNFTGDLNDLASTMHNGIIIIETIGNGLNMVTGDYSVGASGMVVTDGVINHFVDNLTLSGNMLEIFKHINLIANDSAKGGVICGSMLIEAGIIQVSN